MPLPLRRISILICLAIPTIAISGCSGSNRPERVKVHGRVTLNGGDWPGDGIRLIAFHTVKPAEGFIGRPGQAKFGPSGAYTAGTYEDDDGLVPGEYDVRITFEKRKPGSSDEAPPEMFIEKHERLFVPADGTDSMESNFDVRR